MTAARERVLDAYEELLIEQGPAAVTLDAVAATAGVSKGGLLYHFGSKGALAAGLFDRLRLRGAADAEAIGAAPDGAVAYYLRTSAPGGGVAGGLTRSYLAVLRLADASSSGQGARAALATVDTQAYAVLQAELDDPVLAFLAQLLGDGLYLRTLTGTPLPAGLGVGDLLDRIRAFLPPPSTTS